MSPTHNKGTQTPRQVNNTQRKRGAQSFPYTKNQPQPQDLQLAALTVDSTPPGALLDTTGPDGSAEVRFY